MPRCPRAAAVALTASIPEYLTFTMSADDPHFAAVRRIARDLEAALSLLTAASEKAGASEDLYAHLAQALDACLAQLHALNLWGPDNRLLSSEMWNRCGAWLCRGWLQNQARTKPRGYAGDYLLLSRIYRGELCDDPLGRLFDRYFLAQAAPQAVANRMSMMADWIVAAVRDRAVRSDVGRHPLRLAVVGSAFGLEVAGALRRLNEAERATVQVTLLDLDPAAVEFAREQLRSLLRPHQLVTHSTNLFRLPERKTTAAMLGNADWVFCPGLFDYLPDADAVAMLHTLYGQLAPSGRLTIFQFAPHNPTRAYMEWIANWYLIYRDAHELRRLVEQAALSAASAEYGAEPLGVDLFVTLTRQH